MSECVSPPFTRKIKNKTASRSSIHSIQLLFSAPFCTASEPFTHYLIDLQRPTHLRLLFYLPSSLLSSPFLLFPLSSTCPHHAPKQK